MGGVGSSPRVPSVSTTILGINLQKYNIKQNNIGVNTVFAPGSKGLTAATFSTAMSNAVLFTK